ncbi:MAG: YkgJ family cysteine cluster protein [Candidatus Bathyarchaeia archaeon]
MSLTYPKNITFTCNDCGICCGDTQTKNRHILLTQKDADRITKHTNQIINTFAEKIEGKHLYIYEMQKNPKTQKCTFHKNNQCTIYQQRPLICRFYPFQLTTTEDNNYAIEVTNECPNVNTPNQKEKPLTEQHYKQLLKLAQNELETTDDTTTQKPN